ncbi:hypothetical protein H0H93_010252 [Arthromyces matolae]|nr:hypothetical protein H0H93_010252 [Arthromyces matolae]
MPSHPPTLLLHPQRRASYTAPTKKPSPLRHATSFSRSSTTSNSDDSSSNDPFSCTPFKAKPGLSSLEFDLSNDPNVVSATKRKRNTVHLLPILKRADNTLIRTGDQTSIKISIHTAGSRASTSFSSSSESSGDSSSEPKRRTPVTPSLTRPRDLKPSATLSTTSSKPKKPKVIINTRVTENPRASLPERQRQRHVSFLPPGTNPGPKNPRELHPLLSLSPVRKFARFLDLPSPTSPLSLSYDIASPPSLYSVAITRTTPLDKSSNGNSVRPSRTTLGPRMITTTLAEPATVPPTMSQLILTSSKFPWEVVATSARKGSVSTCSPNASSESIALARHITNLDVLHSIHLTLAARVLPEEWAALSSAQKKRVLKAYEQRCVRTEGGWDEGVRRLDYLCGSTVLVGIEFPGVDERGDEDKPARGKMVFAAPC